MNSLVANNGTVLEVRLNLIRVECAECISVTKTEKKNVKRKNNERNKKYKKKGKNQMEHSSSEEAVVERGWWG